MARRRRRRPPEVQAALDRLKRDIAASLAPRGPGARGQVRGTGRRGPSGEGPMVTRMLDIAARHLDMKRRGRPPSAPRPAGLGERPGGGGTEGEGGAHPDGGGRGRGGS